jgi:hypothetical protein
MLQVPTSYASTDWFNLIVPVRIFTTHFCCTQRLSQLEFNVFDMIGRSLPYVFVIPPKWVWPPALGRVIFFPLVILCVLSVFPQPELCLYAINVLCALSNGFLGSVFPI